MSFIERPRAVVFDWDNTLVESWIAIREALNHTLEAMGHAPWPMEAVKERVRHSLRNSFPLLFGADWETARQIYLDRFQAIHLAHMQPIEGALPLLDRLGALGIYRAVVSNKTGPILRREVAALGWEQRFGRVVGAGDAALDKPARAPIDLALDGSGIAAGESVWYVGDTGLDIECALNAGCLPVLVHMPVPPPPHEADAVARARFSFADFKELAGALPA